MLALILRRARLAIPTRLGVRFQSDYHLEQNGVEWYLNKLKAAGVEPTLNDLERFKPKNRHDPGSSEYEKQFETLVDQLSRAFSKEQLRSFCTLYKVKTWSSITKQRLVLAIIEQKWGWPSLEEIKRKQLEETKTEHLSFALTPAQLFLILGQDGVELLRMSRKYNVHISLVANPLQLKIEGLQISTQKLEAHLKEITQNTVEDGFQLPTKTPIRGDLVQRLSRLAGAFIQNLDEHGKIRICARDPVQLEAAKRLVVRTACEVTASSSDSRLIHVPPGVPSSTPIPSSLFPNSYSIYPFMSPRSLPWTMNTSGAFRIRRVSEWLGSSSMEDIQKTGGLAESRGRIVTINEEAQDIKEALLSKLPNFPSSSEGQSLVVTASLGHMLFTSISTDQRANVVPPMKGFWTISQILDWLRGVTMNAVFLPSLPAPLINTSPTKQKTILRLNYRTLPDPHSSAEAPRLVKLEVALPQLAEPPDMFGISDSGSQQEREITGSDFTLIEPSWWQGNGVSVDLMMPDRFMDLRFSAFSLRELPSSDLPPALSEYLSALKGFYLNEGTQPLAPLTITVDGRTYFLTTYTTVHQSIELWNEADSGSQMQPTQAISESAVDVESRQKTMQCQVSCTEVSSSDSWQQFLRNCDYLSSMSYRPIVSSTPLNTNFLAEDGDEIIRL